MWSGSAAMPTRAAPVADLTGLQYKRDELQCPACRRWVKALYAKNGKPVCQDCLKEAT